MKKKTLKIICLHYFLTTYNLVYRNIQGIFPLSIKRFEYMYQRYLPHYFFGMRVRWNKLSRPRKILGLLGASVCVGPLAFSALAPFGRVRGIPGRNSDFSRTPTLTMRVSEATRGEIYDAVQMTYDRAGDCDYCSDPQLSFSTPDEHKVVKWGFQEQGWWNGFSQCVRESTNISLTQHSYGGVNLQAPGDKYRLLKCTENESRPKIWAISIRESKTSFLLEEDFWKKHLAKSNTSSNVNK